MIDININEAIRYLGYGRSKPDERTMNLIRECVFAVQEAADPRCVTERFDLNVTEDDYIEAAGIRMHSSNLSKNLKGCKEIIFFAATLGNGPDMLMARYSRLQISKAAVLQAVAAAAIEGFCNEQQQELEKDLKKEHLFLRPRFSPGYGDLSLEHQPDFLRILNTQKRIGLVLSEGGVMIPEKSVTAVMGISRVNSRCHIEGCESCNNKNCQFRRES